MSQTKFDVKHRTAEGQRLDDVDCCLFSKLSFTEVTDQSYDLKKPQQLLFNKVNNVSFAGENMKLDIENI